MIGKFLSNSPRIAKTAFIAPSARLIGAVAAGEHSSIWYGVVARADINRITIGAYTNIQDGAILHVEDDRGLYVGDHVTVGHGAILHACHIEDYALIGMGAIVLNGARIGKGSIVGAGALVTKDFLAPAYRLILGSPAKAVRELTSKEKKGNIHWAMKYARLSQEYIKKGMGHA